MKPLSFTHEPEGVLHTDAAICEAIRQQAYGLQAAIEAARKRCILDETSGRLDDLHGLIHDALGDTIEPLIDAIDDELAERDEREEREHQRIELSKLHHINAAE